MPGFSQFLLILQVGFGKIIAEWIQTGGRVPVANQLLYVELDVFAALILLVIMEHGKRRLNLTQRLFKRLLISVVVVLLSDAVTWGLNGASFPGARTLNVIANYIYWFSGMLPCYLALLYCMSVVYGRVLKLWKWLFLLPVLGGAVLLLLNGQNGWIFTVSADNIYARGPYFLVVGAMPFLHLAVAIAITVWKYLHAQFYERKTYLMLALYMLVTVFGSVLQILIYGLLTIWISIALSLLMCYVYIQNGSLSTDHLTGLNNRARFDAYSAWLWEHRKDYGGICLMVLDVDRFKSINDGYGHSEGDRALSLIAAALKAAMADRRGFLSRIGGDEFAILLTNAEEGDDELLAAHITLLLQAGNERGEKPYTVSASIGSAWLRDDEESFRTFFSRADQAMYRQKSERRG
jgi:diguanylate cyclase (GGDEF)-like protein